jgi:predicted DNA-binding protein
MSAENRRTDSIRVRLSEDMMTRFDALAARYGMPPATLGAFAIARFVTSEENSLSLSREALKNIADKSIPDISDEAMSTVITSALDALLKSGAITPEEALKASRSL